jgi:uncharacterized protein YjbI with pentapeptide repeats
VNGYDPFIKEATLGGSEKKRIFLDRLGLCYGRYFDTYREWELTDVDFNKFNNNKKAELPCLIHDSWFQCSFINCSFASGKLDKVSFLSYVTFQVGEKTVEYGPYRIRGDQYYLTNKIENCDFSRTQLKDVDFGGNSLKGSKFDDADIQGVNFAANVSFHNPITLYTYNTKGVNPRYSTDEYANPGSYFRSEKSIIVLMKSNGLQKEQLEKTASFKNKKLLGIKFCMDMKGLNLSQFNLTGCKFSGDLTDVNLTNAVITDCVFGWNTNLTTDQIKSTWNYKNNQMQGIKFFCDFDDAL